MPQVYEIRPRKDHRGVDLISDALPFGRLWYDTPDNAIGYAMHSSHSHDAVIHVYDAAARVIETRRLRNGIQTPTAIAHTVLNRITDRRALWQSSLPPFADRHLSVAAVPA